MRMTREELKEDFKQSEGDPHVKARQKQIDLGMYVDQAARGVAIHHRLDGREEPAARIGLDAGEWRCRRRADRS